MLIDQTQYRGSPSSLRSRPEVVEDLDALDARRLGVNALVRTHAGFLIARHGLACTAELTEEEVEVCRRQGPLVDERARGIVDKYVKMVKTELDRLPLAG